MIEFELKTYIPNYLVKVDKTIMASTIEAMVPFLDMKEIEFSERLPQNFKMNGKTSQMLTEYEVSKEYEKDHSYFWMERFVDFLLREIGIKNVKNLKVLELGSGRGNILEILKKKGAVVQGIDNDRFMLSVCKKKGITAKKLNLENDKFPFKNENFDLIMSDMMIEHVYNPHNFMSESKRVLKKGGFMIHRTVNWKYYYKNFFNGLGHVRPYTEETLKELFDMHKLETIKIYPRFGHYKFLWRYFEWSWGRKIFSPITLNYQLLGIARKST